MFSPNRIDLWFQEINRLIRDNERLHRIIVRHGGAEAFRNVDAVLPGTAFGDAMNATVDESVNASFFNATQSPGLQFSGIYSSCMMFALILFIFWYCLVCAYNTTQRASLRCPRPPSTPAASGTR